MPEGWRDGSSFTTHRFEGDGCAVWYTEREGWYARGANNVVTGPHETPALAFTALGLPPDEET